MDKIAYLSIGSNLGDRFANIENAIALIQEQLGTVILKSSIYITEPVGFSADLDFFNLCIAIETNSSPTELLEKLKSIEKQLGRNKKSVNGIYESRLIDIDIILFGNIIVNDSQLNIPHKKYLERMFVLKPLAEIAADIIDPIKGKTIKQLFNEYPDQSDIKIYKKKFNQTNRI